MAINFKNVIDDKTKFPDDASFTLAGEQITFGELRRQNTDSRGELEKQLTARAAELDAKDQTQKRAVETLARVLENVSARTGLSYDQLVKGDIPANLRPTVSQITRETRTDNGLQLQEDPLYKPLFDSVIAPMGKDVDLVRTGLVQAISAYKNDHTLLNWLHFQNSGEKPDGFKASYEDVLQHAVNKGYQDNLGFPDISRAAKEMAGPVVQKADSDKVRKEGYDEGYKKAQAEMAGQLGAPQPGTGGISFEAAPAGKEQRTATIREKLNEAFQDPSIVGTMFGTVQ
jgi:hypothetical protein